MFAPVYQEKYIKKMGRKICTKNEKKNIYKKREEKYIKKMGKKTYTKNEKKNRYKK